MTKNNHGFTLIELIVTLAVIGVLFALTAPNIQTTIKNNRLSTQYNDMRGDLAFARDLAINRNVAVIISSNSGTNWSDGWTISSSIGTARISNTVSNVAINSSTLSSLTYNPDGTTNLTASSGFKICDDRTGNVGKILNVNFAGRVSRTEGASCP